MVEIAALCLKLSSTFILSCCEVCPSINGLIEIKYIRTYREALVIAETVKGDGRVRHYTDFGVQDLKHSLFGLQGKITNYGVIG